MTQLPEQFDYDGIHCYRSRDDAQTLLYIPGSPSPQRSAEGAPMISLLSFAPFAFLQLSAQWEATADQLDRLRSALVQRDPQLDIAQIQLALAPLAVDRAALELLGANGSSTELQSAQPSGMPPFSSLFNLQLSETQQAAATSALNGRAGVLSLRYYARLATPFSASVTLAGNATAETEQLRAQAPVASLGALIDAALASGRVALSRSGDLPPDDARWEALIAKAKREAGDLLRRMAAGLESSADAAHFRASHSETVIEEQQIERVADISTWFGARSGIDHFQVVG